MINNFKDLISNLSNSTNSAADEIRKIYGSEDGEENSSRTREERKIARQERRAERRAERQERRLERRERREARRSEREAVNTDDLTKVDENVDQVNADESIEELARLYVKQYEDNAGRDLSDDEFEAKVKDVSKFYSELDNGKERLDDVVFANDSEESKTDVVV